MVSVGYHVAVLSDVLVEFHYIFISCFCFWSKPATPHKCFIVCSVSGMELFFYLWSHFMLSRGVVIIMMCVHLRMHAYMYFITNCVFCYCYSHLTLLVQYSFTIASMSFLLILYEI